MEIKVSTEQARVPVTVMHVDGNIDSATHDSFKARADELIQGGARYILVDLSHAPFVSSAGLRALHSIFNTLRSLQPDSKLTNDQVKRGIAEGTYKSPHLKLLNLSQETQTAFKLSGFDMFIETFADRQAALASF
jgi:anti-anti-sigma factor